MSDYGQRFGNPDDYAAVDVFFRSGKDDAPIFTVVFKNREAQVSKRLGVVMIGSLVLILALGGVGFATGSPYAAYSGILALAWMLWVWLRTMVIPIRSKWEIVIDYASDRFYGLRDGRREFDQRLSALNKLSVDDHPDMHIEREQRANEKKSGVGKMEKQHVLVGWFGPQGASRLDLVARYEWPKRYTLQEVQAAIVSVMQTVASLPPQQESGAGSIAPPLD
jgi:hypothetical protein